MRLHADTCHFWEPVLSRAAAEPEQCFGTIPSLFLIFSVNFMRFRTYQEPATGHCARPVRC